VSKDPIPTLNSNVLQGVADVLGATDGGLTGSKIAHVLSQVRVPDVSPSMTKRKRLFNALATRQNLDKVGNCTALSELPGDFVYIRVASAHRRLEFA